MTVEVGILNKQGIALAADSAITIGNGNMFYNTANKLFTLSKFNPVGIMIYSSSDFMEYPIEIFVKEYRKNLKDTSFLTLKEYWDDFLSYLVKKFEDKTNAEYFLYHVRDFLVAVDAIIRDGANELDILEDKTKDDIEEELVKMIDNIIDNIYNTYIEYEDDEEFKSLENIIKDQCSEQIKNIIEEKIGLLNDKEIQKLIDICIMILTKNHKNGNRTGIVIAGYGENELYPSIINGEFLGIFWGKIKYTIKDEVNITNDMDASILPFAQSDVINTFMSGIDSVMHAEIIETIDECKNEMCRDSCECDVNLCMDKLKKNVQNKIEEFSSELHWGPILNAVSVAPKEELAHMAETLVNLTSFRRKLTMDSYSQSVGGPIDVALITKGDGFVWIKRKHYFDKELNNNFFQTYYR